MVNVRVRVSREQKNNQYWKGITINDVWYCNCVQKSTTEMNLEYAGAGPN
jgi:hypothetical protein